MELTRSAIRHGGVEAEKDNASMAAERISEVWWERAGLEKKAISGPGNMKASLPSEIAEIKLNGCFLFEFTKGTHFFRAGVLILIREKDMASRVFSVLD